MKQIKLVSKILLMVVCLLASYPNKLFAADEKSVSIFELLTEQFDSNRKVITSGYLRNTAEGVFIYPYAQDALNRDFTREVYLNLPKKSILEVLKNCANKYVFVEGVFYSGNKILKQISDISAIYELKRPIGGLQRQSCIV